MKNLNDGRLEQPLFAIVFTKRGLLYFIATLLFLIITTFVVIKVATQQPEDQKKIVVTPAPAPKKPRGPFGTPAEVLEGLIEQGED